MNMIDVKSSKPAFFLASFITVTTAAAPAFAYLDPATGSIILQLVLGGIVGAGAMIKLYWAKIKGLFQKSPTDGADPQE